MFVSQRLAKCMSCKVNVIGNTKNVCGRINKVPIFGLKCLICWGKPNQPAILISIQLAILY